MPETLFGFHHIVSALPSKHLSPSVPLGHIG